MGFVSHGIIDMYFIEFNPFPLSKYWWWLAIQIMIVGVVLFFSPVAVVFGIIGGLLPDLIDGVQGLLLKPDGSINILKELSSGGIQKWMSESRWNHGINIMPFHKPGSARVHKEMSLTVNIVVSLLSLLVFLKVKTKKK